jgi:hypothetical protein
VNSGENPAGEREGGGDEVAGMICEDTKINASIEDYFLKERREIGRKHLIFFPPTSFIQSSGSKIEKENSSS